MGLDEDQVNVLKRCFDGFADEDGAIPAENVGNILSMMGLKVYQVNKICYEIDNDIFLNKVKPSALKEIIEEIDEDGSGELNLKRKTFFHNLEF